MKYARIVDSVVFEVFTPPAGFQLVECFTPQVVTLFQSCPDYVEQNWIKQQDGSFLAPPPPPEPVVPPVIEEPETPIN